MASPHVVHAPAGPEGPARAPTLRERWHSPSFKVAGALLVLVVLGIVTGQTLGHLLAAGIESLLDLVAVDAAG